MEWGNTAVPTVQYTHGMITSGEVLVACGQNGEMLRPENGYPLRLVVPGVQGASWIKYLRRIKVSDMPYGAKDETLHYADLMPDGTHRQYSSVQEVKSVITSPSGGQVVLQKGFHSITGLAWSGRGAVKKVDVSLDGGRNWKPARLRGPVLSKCLTRFNADFVWDGKPVILQSRAVDDAGQIQPTYQALMAVRGGRSTYRNNAIQSWPVVVVSSLPEHARNAHGNLAEQSRTVGPSRGAHTTADKDTKIAQNSENTEKSIKYGCSPIFTGVSSS